MSMTRGRMAEAALTAKRDTLSDKVTNGVRAALMGRGMSAPKANSWAHYATDILGFTGIGAAIDAVDAGINAGRAPIASIDVMTLGPELVPTRYDLFNPRLMPSMDISRRSP